MKKMHKIEMFNIFKHAISACKELSHLIILMKLHAIVSNYLL